MPELKASRVHLRGFASMTPERRSEIASAGGRRAHQIGAARQFTSETAREAGRKGGLSKAAGVRINPARKHTPPDPALISEHTFRGRLVRLAVGESLLMPPEERTTRAMQLYVVNKPMKFKTKRDGDLLRVTRVA